MGSKENELKNDLIESVKELRSAQKRFERFGERYRERKEKAEKKVDEILSVIEDKQLSIFQQKLNNGYFGKIYPFLFA